MAILLVIVKPLLNASDQGFMEFGKAFILQ